MQNSRLKICLVTTTSFSVSWYLAPHILAQQHLFDVTVVADGFLSPDVFPESKKFHFVSMGIKRKISLVDDLKCLFRLWWLFRKEGYDVVHSIMPKAGLLAMMAASFARVPVRIHTFTGQIWVNSIGLRRKLLKNLDRTIVFFSTGILTDSESQKDFIIQQKIVPHCKIDVLGHGSIAGVKIQRFALKTDIRINIRAKYGIKNDDLVYLFLGRLTAEKGIRDLLIAFENIAKVLPNTHLMIVGPDEGRFTEELSRHQERNFGRVHVHGLTSTPESFMSAGDIFCLPSYREGFGSVILEAAVAGLPCIASRIYGITDAVQDYVTGILIEPGSISGLVEAMLLLARDHHLRRVMGVAAKKRAIENFSEDFVVDALISHYLQKSQSHQFMPNHC